MTQQRELAVAAAAPNLRSVVVEPEVVEAAPAAAVLQAEPVAVPAAQAVPVVAAAEPVAAVAVPVAQAVQVPAARPSVAAANLSTLAPQHKPCPMKQVRYSHLVGGPDLTKFAHPYREAVSDRMKSAVHWQVVPESARAGKPRLFRSGHAPVAWAERVV